ncbi:MAG TPA: 3-hydroxyacyl-CoA dehydrogenase NAD-binding domain-containing protein, partial [Solirubrobacterales bacterium]|nr:3-hydroxyacyl-CoA dehydrogenase NAD-binding domain-containing protein [Solirubrobacterales bacterium]
MSSPPQRIGVVGIGYVGLPLAVAFAEQGVDVVCVDADESKLDALREGRSYIEDIPAETLAPLRERLHPSSDYAPLAECEAVIVCVPTPLTNSREPDLTYLLGAAEGLAAVLKAGQLVVL